MSEIRDALVDALLIEFGTMNLVVMKTAREMMNPKAEAVLEYLWDAGYKVIPRPELELQPESAEEELGQCPKCSRMTLRTKWYGVECTGEECDYWFCY